MKKHILIVDDDSSIRESLQKILATAGYSITTVSDGESAASEFGNADLVVLDLNLPIQDGWDILGHVNASYPLLPVIIITGLVNQLDEKTIPGASAFLEKPVEVSLLLTTVERLLNQTPAERVEELGRTTERCGFSLPRVRRGGTSHKIGRQSFRRFRSLK